MAHAVAEGAASVPGATVDLRELADERLTEISLDDARACDALIVGTSMRHRSMHHRVKLFVENVLEVIWMTDDMVGKVGGVFSVGGGHGNNGAGCELAQVGLLAAMAANGLVLVTHPKCTPGFDEAGSHWGPNGRTGDVKMRPHPLTDGMLAAGHHHGANVARVAAALVAGAGGRDLFARGNVAPRAGGAGHVPVGHRREHGGQPAAGHGGGQPRPRRRAGVSRRGAPTERACPRGFCVLSPAAAITSAGSLSGRAALFSERRFAPNGSAGSGSPGSRGHPTRPRPAAVEVRAPLVRGRGRGSVGPPTPCPRPPVPNSAERRRGR
jgi:NAD(P)H dehydrogenase (quinone)